MTGKAEAALADSRPDAATLPLRSIGRLLCQRRRLAGMSHRTTASAAKQSLSTRQGPMGQVSEVSVGTLLKASASDPLIVVLELSPCNLMDRNCLKIDG